MKLVGYGRAGTVGPVGRPELVARKNRIEHRRGDLVEWYVNHQQGLEQGFTLHHPPAGRGGRVTLELLLEGDLVPVLAEVGSIPDTGDGRIDDCESVHWVKISQRLVTFSEPVYDPPGDSDPHDVTNPATYLLVAAGDDLEVATLVCGPPAGDDDAVPITAAGYDSGSLTANLELGTSLANGVLRLLVCGSTSIRDIFANSLDGDGDGTGGDDFSLDFRVDAHNILDNGHFDCSLDGWKVTETIPGAVNHSFEDADDSSLSGSAEVYNPSDTGVPESFTLSQCAPLPGVLGFSTDLKVKLAAAHGSPAKLGCGVADRDESGRTRRCGGDRINATTSRL